MSLISILTNQSSSLLIKARGLLCLLKHKTSKFFHSKKLSLDALCFNKKVSRTKQIPGNYFPPNKQQSLPPLPKNKLNATRGLTKMTGLGLLEIILLLLIVSTVITLGTKFYLMQKRDANVEVVKHEVSVLEDALASYYNGSCIVNPMDQNEEVPDYSNLTIQDLIDAGDLPKNYVFTNPYAPDDDKSVRISIVAKNLPTNDQNYLSHCSGNRFCVTKKWYVSVVLKITNIAQGQNFALKGRLGADQLMGDNLIWEKAPARNIGHTHSNLWTMRAQQSEFTKDYQWAPWMINSQDMTIAEKAKMRIRLNNVCQT